MEILIGVAVYFVVSLMLNLQDADERADNLEQRLHDVEQHQSVDPEGGESVDLNDPYVNSK